MKIYSGDFLQLVSHGEPLPREELTERKFVLPLSLWSGRVTYARDLFSSLHTLYHFLSCSSKLKHFILFESRGVREMVHSSLSVSVIPRSQTAPGKSFLNWTGTTQANEIFWVIKKAILTKLRFARQLTCKSNLMQRFNSNLKYHRSRNSQFRMIIIIRTTD